MLPVSLPAPGNYTRFREFQFFPDQGRWKRSDNNQEGTLATPLPLDDLSFIYFARSLNMTRAELRSGPHF